MVIQRWQSLLLLIATVIMVCINFSPLAQHVAVDGKPAPMFVTDVPILLILDIVIGILLFLAIFLFKNLRLQMRVTVLTILLMCVMAVTGGIVLYRDSAVAGVEWSGAVLLLIVAVIVAIRALARMRHDDRLLRSADRLR